MLEKLNFPKPQMVRRDWVDLNGEWDFCFDDDNIGHKDAAFTRPGFFDRKIIVPYAYQTKNSGIGLNEDHPVVWYRRLLPIMKNQEKRYLLHFEAVDYKADIYLDGQHLYCHEGGSTPFTMDITDMVRPNCELVVRVEDYNRTCQPIGKQSWKKENFLCWYTRTTGIWQQVWLEEVGSTYLSEIRMTPDIDAASLHLDLSVAHATPSTRVEGQVYFQGELITAFSSLVKSGRVRLSVDVSSEEANFRLHFWSPADPNLYDIVFDVIEEGRMPK